MKTRQQQINKEPTITYKVAVADIPESYKISFDILFEETMKRLTIDDN